MKLKNYEILKSEERGFANHGWLKSKHTFSFANYHNPKQMGFSDLLVINEDIVQGNMGFGMHPHKNMEIFSYILEGSLAHKDSMGNGEVIKLGDVQLMSAGTGVFHSEFNNSSVNQVHFLQIWIKPSENGGDPKYQQKHFNELSKLNKLKLIISPDGEDGSLLIKQNTKVYAGVFEENLTYTFKIDEDRAYYIHVVSGSLSVNDINLNVGDAIKIHGDNKELIFNSKDKTEIILFDLNKQY